MDTTEQQAPPPPSDAPVEEEKMPPPRRTIPGTPDPRIRMQPDRRIKRPR